MKRSAPLRHGSHTAHGTLRREAATVPVHNPDIAQAMDDLADLLELQDANPFRVRAYRNAARVVRGLSTEITAMLQRGDDLAELPGIGRDIAEKIRTLASTGRLPALDRLRKAIPPIASVLLKLPGLGPKRVRILCVDLKIRNMGQLRHAVSEGRIRELPGFGPVLEAKLSQALAAAQAAAPRTKWALAESYVDPLLTWLRGALAVKAAIVAGSYRRRQETIGDIDVLVTADRSAPAIRRFIEFPEVAKVIAVGGTRATVVLRSGLQVDLRVVSPRSYGSALHYFTGSRAHSIAVRRLGQQIGLKINEYGVFRGARRVAGRTEEDVYRAIGLPYIEPELREDRGELQAAAEGRLPKLLELSDLKGDLHVHTNATDGHDSIEDLARAAGVLGREYIAITDHSRRLAMTHGLDPRQLLRQIDEIDRLNEAKLGVTLLKGIEVDILEDGKLDLPDFVLKRLDVVIGAVHSRFGLPRERQTERVLRAMERPYFTILAHPTGRLIGEREAYDIDVPRIIHAAKERGCFMELNAHPDRLDMTDLHCRLAKDEGVLISIATDAHRSVELSNLRFGVAQGRRGWLEKGDVLNARPLGALRSLLARAMGR